MTHKKKYVIVGAGLCGLTTGQRLAAAGHDVTVLERSPFVAGLARSLRHDDGFVFDIGPHFFFLSVRSDVSDYVRRMVRKPYSEIDYQISANFRGKDIAWPPSATSLFKLPPAAVLHYLRKMVKHQYPTESDFEGVTTFLYGKSLYEVFFGPYIHKKLPVVEGAELHRDWWILARRGTDNRLDVKRDQGLSKIAQATQKKQVTLGKKVMKTVDIFYRTGMSMISKKGLPKVLYPHQGIGCIGEGIADEFVKAGGRLVLNARGVKLERSGERIARVSWDGGAIEAPEHVVWTGSIHELADQMGVPRAKVDYMSVALVFVRTNKRIERAQYLYTYYADKELIFNRVSFPTRASKELAPPGADSICAECSPSDGSDFEDRKALEQRVIDGLVKVGLIRPADVARVDVHVAKDSYPIYPLDYMQRLEELWSKLRPISNLTSVGRTGQFYYNNMALTVLLGLDLSADLLGEPRFQESASVQQEMSGAT
ncbi:MAG: FAD-dependent oxidoreductase [Planctomycetes bacterium]|nr:FAD-dependent oxidoreductase [Planctomycetota bacterium]